MNSVRLLPCSRAARSINSRWAKPVRRLMTVAVTGAVTGTVAGAVAGAVAILMATS